MKQNPKKRKRIVFLDDREISEDDYKPEDEDYFTSPFFNTTKKSNKCYVKQPQRKKSTKDILLDELYLGDTGRASYTKSWAHLKYDFLQPDKIKDKNQRLPSHPNYDPSTLYIPPQFLDSQTPFMHQWWLLKANHYDCVLFFRFGNFYQLFHMDGVIGANELNLTLIDVLKKGFAHTACSAMSYGRMAGILLERGYKVARIEQTETQEKANQRIAGAQQLAKLDKLIRREVCQITSRGTKVYHTLDTEELEATSPDSVYLLSIVEKCKLNENISTFGVCFIDTTIGHFNIGQFEDDHCNSKLSTMLTHYPPAHIIHECNNLTASTLQLLKRYTRGVRMEALERETQFWSTKKVLKYIQDNEISKSREQSESVWPKSLISFLTKFAKERELAIHALGGCVYLLKKYLIDQQLLSQGVFRTYAPSNSVDGGSFQSKLTSIMVLDAMTMKNLKVLDLEGSLFEVLDYCCTPFGKRLLRSWVCRPLACKSIIIKRQKAIAELLKNHNIVREVRSKLKKLPDLERMLSKIHAQGNEMKTKYHPDGRAVIFDKEKFIKRTVTDFTTTLDAFREVLDIIDNFSEFQSALISDCTKVEPQGNFPDLKETLAHFRNAFNYEETKKIGLIIPKRGVDRNYDMIELELAQIRRELYEYLGAQKKVFGLALEFVGTGTKRFQIEIPESHVHKVAMDYDLQGSRKGFKRYYTPKTRELLAKQIAVEKRKEQLMEDINRKVFAKFSFHFEKWSKATYNIAVLDCLISLVKYAQTCKRCCVPQIYDHTVKQEIFIEVKNGVHPCVYSESYVPNDIFIGIGGAAPLVILTGPNMGGKTTLMRQIGLFTIMAQIGCHVPAASYRLSLTDCIFTRLGASDDIIGGKSTFLVELTETSVILKQATRHSLVLLDELGRGTTTYDGIAIAASVVEALVKRQCRTLFSTHYHSLVHDYKENSNVTLAHMAYVVENNNEIDVNETNVTFLYKLTVGACLKSYGFNVARLAGVPFHITNRALEIATTLENEVNLRHTFTTLCRLENKTMKSSIQETRTIFSSI
ncbi:probable DNA mismatch repair protein Msh6 isoform X2 [Phymastichus coffea]|uniref:probable DNA mismatch repair protein Msh6 isoform X2 n=1 Tax=Phymastichus coffea TaxID=108790 RepID=UPI00273B5C9F|nr:probable DNA mismatch repair protein Msh6 isoform X2 [Phymastichus coffea]